MRGARVLAAAVLLLAALVGAQAFHLPGVATRDYAKGAKTTNKRMNASRQSGVHGRRRRVMRCGLGSVSGAGVGL